VDRDDERSRADVGAHRHYTVTVLVVSMVNMISTIDEKEYKWSRIEMIVILE